MSVRHRFGGCVNSEATMNDNARDMKKTDIYDDVWINTQCRRCQSECALRAHRVNGVVGEARGKPRLVRRFEGRPLLERTGRTSGALRPEPPENPHEEDQSRKGHRRRPQMERDIVGRSPRRNSGQDESGHRKRPGQGSWYNTASSAATRSLLFSSRPCSCASAPRKACRPI